MDGLLDLKPWLRDILAVNPNPETSESQTDRWISFFLPIRRPTMDWLGEIRTPRWCGHAQTYSTRVRVSLMKKTLTSSFSTSSISLLAMLANTMGDKTRSVSTFPLQPCPKRHFSRGVGQPTSLTSVQPIFLRHYYIQYFHEMICFS